MNAYVLSGIEFSYAEPVVLYVPALEVPARQITALAGPNGSGKSTLLRLLGFLSRPTAGRIRFFGADCKGEEYPTFRLRAGLLLQNPYLFQTTVAENVEWGLRLRKGQASRRALQVAAALDLVGLSGFEGRRARDLSGGEAQRLALARLLALEPEVLLLDEPTNHLDLETRTRIEDVLRAWVRDRGGTVVLATHDEAQAHRLGAQVWQMDGGRLREGDADNVYRGQVSGKDPGVFEAGPLRLHVHPLPRAATGVAVSPREVVVSREDYPSSARNHFPGVIMAAHLSPDGQMRLTVDCGLPVSAVVTVMSWKEMGLTVGGEVVVSFKATSVRAF